MRTRSVRKTKLVATIGPACDGLETIKAMMRAGMNVARLNFSHDTHSEHRKRLELVRQAADELSANVAVMLDTKGVEIRTGRLEGGSAQLTTGNDFALFTDGRVGDSTGVSVSYSDLPEEVVPGSKILIDDGVIELEVQQVHSDRIECRINRGGNLSDRKGINLPGTSLGMSAMTAENRADIVFAIENEVDYIAASFVRGGGDVREIRQLLEEHGARIPIIAKIEAAVGVQNLEEIVAEADGTMVARGDLGVEIPVQEVPLTQKKIIRTTVMNGKPVITATQMLDSMKGSPLPTRAEVSDGANAIFDGTSAVMLSNETAAGMYPVEAVRTMASLALEAEKGLREYGHLQQVRAGPSHEVTEAVSQAAITMANHLQASAIIALTESGRTARFISKYRPRCPIVGVSTWPSVVRAFAMNWGVSGVLYPGEVGPAGTGDDDMIDFALRRAVELGIAERGDLCVITAGKSRETGSTNLIRVVTVP
ncbi:MAG: pyruvate kinase [Myxococcota bacterium]